MPLGPAAFTGGCGRRFAAVLPILRAVADTPRYRCTTCGNLTRFDVTTSRSERAFHHYTVGGELTVEDAEVLEERVDEVHCRWCGPTGRVEPVVAGEAVSPPA